jgi:hypothetical protein
MVDIYSETAWQRAQRNLHTFVTSTIHVVIWFVVCNAVVIGATSYLSWGHTRWAQVGIGVLAFVVGSALALLLPLGALWATAPVRQRDEARELLKGQETSPRELLRSLRNRLELIEPTSPPWFPSLGRAAALASAEHAGQTTLLLLLNTQRDVTERFPEYASAFEVSNELWLGLISMDVPEKGEAEKAVLRQFIQALESLCRSQ